MKHLQRISFLIALITVFGCDDNNNKDHGNPPPAASPLTQKVSPAEMQGLWHSEGNTDLIEVTGESVLKYAVSSVHCLLIDDTALADFVEETPHFLTNSQRQRFATDPDLDRFAIHAYFFDRIDERPSACVDGITEETDDALANFNVFWNTFNEQYAFFELRDINWQQQYDDNLAAIEKVADDEELFGILASMIEAFGNDGHVSLAHDDDASAGTDSDLFVRVLEKFAQTYTQQELLDDFNRQTEYGDFDEYRDVRLDLFVSERFQEWLGIIASYMVDGELKSAANDQIAWGLMEDNVGYLFVNSMDEFIDLDEAEAAIEDGTLDEDTVAEQLFTALNEALDKMLADLAGTDAMIIDIRLNGGGEDALSLEIAGRFFDQRRLAFRKKARKGDGYNEEAEIYQKPTVAKPYTKPIYLLTSGETASAAEVFAITMRNLPYVTLVGETTEGILSDILELTLPNGWELGLSNEVYTAADGEVFESIGIAPAISALFLDPDYEANQQDAAIEAVLQDL